MSVHFIHAYTRAEALQDGVLIPIPEDLAREAGLVLPIAMTCDAWASCVEVPKALEGLQDLNGRLWDVLTMFHHAVYRASGNPRELTFAVLVLQPPTDPEGEPEHELVHLKAVCGPGDDHEPVVTLMLPWED